MRIREYFSDIETYNFLLFYALAGRRFKRWSSSQIEQYHREKRRAVAQYAFNHSKLYRNLYDGYNLNDFEKIPIVSKKFMMENLTEWNTLGFTKEEILEFCLEVEKSRDFNRRLRGINIGMSSGTSGNKGVEIVTPREEMYMKAALLARFDIPKGEKMNVAFILRVSAPAFSLNILGHRLSYVGQLNTIENINRDIQRINPNILTGPPSMLKILAKEVEAGRLKIKPKRLIAYAEVFYPDVREYLKNVFQCPIHEIYKCTEGPIGMTCRKERLHINEDLVYVETFDRNGEKTAPGNPCSKLVITDLHKRGQPIIRYQLNDIITISPEKCTCGSNFRVIENIQGRADDLFWGKKADGNGMQFIFPDLVTRAVITASENIDEYQVIQNAPDSIFVRIELKNKRDEGGFEKDVLISNVKNLFEVYRCVPPRVELRFEKVEANERSNKLIRIKRNFDVKE